MGRARKSKLFPIALTVSQVKDTLPVRISAVRKAIADGSLDARVHQGRVIILVEDIVRWVHTWPSAANRTAYQKLKQKERSHG
jgi:hypothetical protein